jgi:hypothetical protein
MVLVFGAPFAVVTLYSVMDFMETFRAFCMSWVDIQ